MCITIPRPLGIIFEFDDARKRAFVAGFVPGGNAEQRFKASALGFSWWLDRGTCCDCRSELGLGQLRTCGMMGCGTSCACHAGSFSTKALACFMLAFLQPAGALVAKLVAPSPTCDKGSETGLLKLLCLHTWNIWLSILVSWLTSLPVVDCLSDITTCQVAKLNTDRQKDAALEGERRTAVMVPL